MPISSILKKINTGVWTRAAGGYVQVVGSVAYVLGGLGLASFDLTDPSSPRKLGQLDRELGTKQGGNNMMINGDYAFVAGGLGFTGLSVIDISNPGDMKKVGGTETGMANKSGDEAIDLVTDGCNNPMFAFVVGGLGFAVVDVSDPTNPMVVTNIKTGVATCEGGVRLRIVGDYAFLVGGLGMEVFDVSDPEKPVVASEKVIAVAT